MSSRKHHKKRRRRKPALPSSERQTDPRPSERRLGASLVKLIGILASVVALYFTFRPNVVVRPPELRVNIDRPFESPLVIYNGGYTPIWSLSGSFRPYIEQPVSVPTVDGRNYKGMSIITYAYDPIPRLGPGESISATTEWTHLEPVEHYPVRSATVAIELSFTALWIPWRQKAYFYFTTATNGKGDYVWVAGQELPPEKYPWRKDQIPPKW